MDEARDPRKCSAHSQSGKPCENFSMTGQAVCGTHGGRSPQAMAKAQRMIELAELKLRGLAPVAVSELSSLVTSASSEAVRLAAARDLVDRSVGKAVEKVQVAAQIVVHRPW